MNLFSWETFLESKIKLPLIFILFLIITLGFYYPTIESRFTSDFFQWAERYDRIGAAGIWTSFGDLSHKQVYHLVTYTLFKLFRFSGLGWYVAFSLFHSVNALLVFVLSKNLLSSLNIKLNTGIAFFSSLLFLISPFQVETMVWAAVAHYHTAALLFLISNIFFIKYLSSSNPWLLSAIFLSYFIALFSTEAVIILPGIQLSLFFLYSLTNKTKLKLQQFLLFLFIPQLLLAAIFFLLTFLSFGDPVGHYGAQTHLSLNIPVLIATYLKYLLKFLFFLRYLPDSINHFILKVVEQPATGWIILVLLLGLAIFVLIRLKRCSTEFKIVMSLLLTYSISLIPVLNLDASFVFGMQADRYGYIPSVFFYLLIITAFYFYLPKMKVVLVSAYLILSASFLINSTQDVKIAGEVTHNLVDEFSWQDKKHIYILNIPWNYKGAYVFANGFREALKFKYGKDFSSKITILSWLFMISPDDSVTIHTDKKDSYSVGISHFGTWFFWPFSQQENENYQFTGDPSALFYNINFKNLSDKDVVIYQAGKHWKVLKQ